MSPNNASTQFLKSESESFRDQLWNKMSHQNSVKGNMMVEMADFSDCISPMAGLPNRVLTRSESNKRLGFTPRIFGMEKEDSQMSFMNFQPLPEFNKIVKEQSTRTLRSVKREANEEKAKKMEKEEKDPELIMPVLKKEESKTQKSREENKGKQVTKSKKTSEAPKKKKKKRRRDVIFKTILRECRRYFQVQLSDLTGFISSK